MTGTVTVTIPGAPTVGTGEASGLSETEATLKGTVNPEGKPTTYHFNYGTTASYRQKTTEQSAGEGSADQAVSAIVSLVDHIQAAFADASPSNAHPPSAVADQLSDATPRQIASDILALRDATMGRAIRNARIAAHPTPRGRSRR